MISQTDANKLYINITAIQSSIVDTNLSTVAWVTSIGALSTPGAVVLRDMGMNVYLPNPTVPSSAGSQSSILRKVQLVPSNLNGTYGTGGSANANAVAGVPEYFTGYIRLGGMTYGGGTGVPTGVACLN